MDCCPWASFSAKGGWQKSHVKYGEKMGKALRKKRKAYPYTGKSLSKDRYLSNA
jgi:hypothetical protein